MKNPATGKLISIALVWGAGLALVGCAPLAATPDADGAASDIEKVHRILRSGKSIVFVPNTESTYHWGRMEDQGKSFVIGKKTFYENINSKSQEIELANISIAGQTMARGLGADARLLNNKIARWPNPHRLGATGADFAFVATPPGATLFIQKIGPIEVPPTGAGNKKISGLPRIGMLEFEPTLPGLEFGNDRVYKDDAWETRNETTGYLCNVHTCTPIQNQVSRRTRQAGYYDVPVARWGRQGLGATAILDAASSPAYLQVPAAGRIYVTDALRFDIADSFSWNDQACVEQKVDRAHVYDYRECPLMAVSFVKYDASTAVLHQLQSRLAKTGWPDELVSKIEYLPLTKFRLSPSEYKAAISAPSTATLAPIAAIAAIAETASVDSFLAFSLSRKDRHFGGGFGKTESMAKSRAIEKCGKSDCEVMTVASGSACIAAAWGRKSNGDNYDFSTVGNTESEARRVALQSCQKNAGTNCQIYYAQCLPPKQ